jgi:hypothetical protein
MTNGKHKIFPPSLCFHVSDEHPRRDVASLFKVNAIKNKNVANLTNILCCAEILHLNDLRSSPMIFLKVLGL